MRQLALVIVVACGSPHHVTPDAAPVALDLDVVVGHDGVTLYTNASDLGGAQCRGGGFTFPQPGEAATWDDIVECTPATQTCLTAVSVSGGGAMASAVLRSGWGMTVDGDFLSPASSVLHVEGCGGSADIPIGGAIAPVPTMTATIDQAASSITVTWSATPTAASAFILYAFLAPAVFHVTAPQQTFVPPAGGSVMGYANVWVRSFAPPTIVPTVYGDVRVWTGDSIYMRAQ